MATSASTITVASTPTVLTPTDDSVPGQTLVVRNTGPAVIYLGGPDVTTGAGFPVEVDEVFTADVPRNAKVYAVVASGTQAVKTLRIGG